MLKEVENMRRKHLQEEIEKEVIASVCWLISNL